MDPTDRAVAHGAGDCAEEVLTEALRGLRRSALRCRRARVLLDADGAPVPPIASVSAS